MSLGIEAKLEELDLVVPPPKWIVNNMPLVRVQGKLARSGHILPYTRSGIFGATFDEMQRGNASSLDTSDEERLTNFNTVVSAVSLSFVNCLVHLDAHPEVGFSRLIRISHVDVRINTAVVQRGMGFLVDEVLKTESYFFSDTGEPQSDTTRTKPTVDICGVSGLMLNAVCSLAVEAEIA